MKIMINTLINNSDEKLQKQCLESSKNQNIFNKVSVQQNTNVETKYETLVLSDFGISIPRFSPIFRMICGGKLTDD